MKIPPELIKRLLEAHAADDAEALGAAVAELIAILATGEAAPSDEPPSDEPPPEESANPDDESSEEEEEEEEEMSAATKRAIADALKPMAQRLSQLEKKADNDERKALLSKLPPGPQKALADIDIVSLRKVCKAWPESNDVQLKTPKKGAVDPFENPDPTLVAALHAMGEDIDDLRLYAKDPKAYIAAKKAVGGTK